MSDSQWLSDPSGGPLTFSHTYGGEDWDAALEEIGWDQIHFVPSSVSVAVETWQGPGCALVASESLGRPLVVRERFDAVLVFAPKGGGGDVYDFGRNFMGWPRVKVTGPRGNVVRMVCGKAVRP